ncbi:rSAM-modified peptide [Flavobacterium pectinovorum]|uniref:Bacteriocin-type signal sequence-containing protein n=1 Tax=Flavobacterium pectinovorum TaxID=29533 RepID=A0ABY1J230_9FLAO|nr:rSAM-modified peptide [Flavobacterium pectinovorum]SHM06553.1 hypothetical protein SAMN05444387_1831 [Flavobacterium pectinovorum]
MASKKIKLEDFEVEKLSNNQQKEIKGGDGEGPIDPNQLKGGAGNP